VRLAFSRILVAPRFGVAQTVDQQEEGKNYSYQHYNEPYSPSVLQNDFSVEAAVCAVLVASLKVLSAVPATA
tara:strand:+ start:25858 stop:26073 length:216 start_codon:yes stop_codon:yes gene_type:complete